MGANIGYTAALMAKRVWARKVASFVSNRIPPCSKSCKYMPRNGTQTVPLLPLAVSDEAGTALLRVPAEFSENNRTAGVNGRVV